MRNLSIAVACLLTIPFVFSLSANAEDKTLGLVQVKPEKGPFVKTDKGYMVPYKATLPGTEVTYYMTPVPRGKFKMGSPETENDRKANEGPQVEVEVEPFWMGTYEVTWGEFHQFMALHDVFKDFQTHKMRKVTEENAADAVTAPSNLYEPTFTYQFGSGPKQPALSMSQYAAKQYTKWLSLSSGDFHRLPTGAEWEFACRGGSTSAYYFGDDPSKLGEYAWYSNNSDEVTHDVGQKKPNAFGLFDMHGNVAEWVLDAVAEDGYKQFEGKSLAAADAIIWPKEWEGRAVRGGSFLDYARDCRSARQVGSLDNEWRSEDPNIPLSPYWYTSEGGLGVGMRVIRPLNPPPAKERAKYWEADLEAISIVVDDRIKYEGRGARGLIDGNLKTDIIKLEEKKKQR